MNRIRSTSSWLFALVILLALAGPLQAAPPPIPTPPTNGYDHYTILQAPNGNPDQTVFGTPDNDMIAQYGDTNTVTQYAEGVEGDDWLLQVGGEKTNNQTAILGDGDDTVYQYGGNGNSHLYGEAGTGNDTIVQVGGVGANYIEAVGGSGYCVIKQYGDSGPNTMKVTGGSGDDVIEMYGGPGTNTMTYNVSSGSDLVTILGGGGYTTLSIYKRGNNFTLKDYRGRVLFQTGSGGTTITVANLNRITVIGDAGKPIYTYNPGIVPASIAPLLLLGN